MYLQAINEGQGHISRSRSHQGQGQIKVNIKLRSFLRRDTLDAGGLHLNQVALLVFKEFLGLLKISVLLSVHYTEIIRVNRTLPERNPHAHMLSPRAWAAVSSGREATLAP